MPYSLQGGIIDDDDLLKFLLGDNLTDTSSSSPCSDSTSSDSYLTPSPGIDDVDLDMDISCDMISTTTSSPGETQSTSEDNFTIDFGEMLANLFYNLKVVI